MESTRRSSRIAAKPPVPKKEKATPAEKEAIKAARAIEKKNEKEARAAARAIEKEAREAVAKPKPEAAPIQYTVVEAKGRQLTLAELFAALSEYLEKNPESGTKPVFHVEFGGITESHTITFDTFDDDSVVIE